MESKWALRELDEMDIKTFWGTSLAVRWLRLHFPNTRGMGSTSYRQTKIPQCSQVKKEKKKEYSGASLSAVSQSWVDLSVIFIHSTLTFYLPSGKMTVWLQEALPFSLPSMDSSLFAFPFSKLILKEINPEYSLEGLMMKLKLQYFGHLIRKADIRKDPDGGKEKAEGEVDNRG